MKRLFVLLLLSGCALPPPAVDSMMLAPVAIPVAMESVRFVEPAPECPQVARLTARVLANEPERGRLAIQKRAGEIGANTLFLTSSPGGNAGTLPMVQLSALALRCP